MSINRYEHFIDGKSVAPGSGQYFDSIDPSDGQVFAQVARGDAGDVDRAVAAAARALPVWRKAEPRDRGRILHRAGMRLLNEADELARTESRDTGFPLRDCLMVARDVAARYFEFYSGLADKLNGETISVPGNHLDYTLREPLGVLGQIIPWNSPLYDGSRYIAPALACGNTIVLKPAEEAMVSIFRLAQILKEEGLPDGVLNIVTGFGPEAGAALAAHPDINGLFFTGSIDTGASVMSRAAKHVVPVHLELGGKSANIVCRDANIDMAVMWSMIAIFTASGQICTAGSRLLLDKPVHDEFMAKLVEATRSLRVGPALESPDVGPVISRTQMDRILNYIEIGRQEGASLAIGGTRLTEGPLKHGYFVAPTIFDGVKNNMRISQEEIFGPVLSVLTFEDPEEALAIANGTQYGLAAGVWTRDLKTAHYMAKNLEAGSVYINRYFPAGLEAPGGTFKRSGIGSVDGVETLRHYTRVKNVVLNLD
jgi:aldehyde dehydrogenase (NAD+)